MQNFINFMGQHFDGNGNPLSNGLIKCFQAGTTTPKELFFDIDKQSSAGSVINLNSVGQSTQDLFMGSGNYKFEYYKDLNGTLVKIDERDNIVGDSAMDSMLFVNYDTIQAVNDLRFKAPNTPFVQCLSYDGNMDSSLGGGWFKWIADDLQVDDGGSVFKYNLQAMGSYIRILSSEVVYPQMFGMLPSSPFGQSSALISCINFIQNHPRTQKPKLVLPSGSFKIDSNIDIDGISVVVEDRFQIINTLIATEIQFTFNDCNIEWLSISEVVTTNIRLIFNLNEFVGNLSPMNFGAIGTGSLSALDFNAFLKMQLCMEASLQLPIISISKNYNLDSTGYMGSTQIVIPDAHFKTYSSITSNYLVRIHSYSADELSVYLFRSPTLLKITNGQMSIAHFMNPSLGVFSANRTFYSQIMSSITDSPNPICRYDYNQAIFSLGGSATYLNVLNEVSRDNSIIVTSSGAYFGQFRDSDKSIFNSSISNYPILDYVNPKWYGNSMANALGCASYSSFVKGFNVFVDGRNETFSVTGAFTEPQNNFLNMKNITIRNTNGLAGPVVVYYSQKVNLDNVTLYGSITNAVPSNPSTANVSMKNCTIFADGVTYDFVGNNISIENCKFNGSNNWFAFGNSSQHLSSLSLKDNAIIGLTRRDASQGSVNIFAGSSVLINDNSFSITDPNVSGTTSIVKMNGQGQSVSGLSFQDNNFISTNSGNALSLIDCIGVSGFANIGHSAIIRNNVSNLPTSKMILTQSKAISGPRLFTLLATPSLVSKCLFPFTLEPQDITIYARGGANLDLLATNVVGGNWSGTYQLTGGTNSTNGYYSISVN